ncbi:hypothetical protein C9374_002708 [Naegleria lovaniensis]|uniref:Uncharacterized protein n=1 Tax=Naegleria lovaniensis TaxID=51637 RepID=A0AA88KQB3_NAELO|nr:uncharacterized protein C9374_002708 [Naegleria lovaniensis]KAG2386262.1 hypothetical protein C9374_002708 [Naegleria lovaniensis]
MSRLQHSPAIHVHPHDNTDLTNDEEHSNSVVTHHHHHHSSTSMNEFNFQISSILSQIYSLLSFKTISIILLVYLTCLIIGSIFFFFIVSTDVSQSQYNIDQMNIFEYIYYSFVVSRRILHWKRLLILVVIQLLSFLAHFVFFLLYFQYCKQKYVKGPLMRMEHLRVIYRQREFIIVSILCVLSLVVWFFFAPQVVSGVFGV